MQNAQLYINDVPLHLPADSLIALSYAVNTLTDLKTVQGNISNTITLPNTPHNRAVLGYPDDMNFNGAAIIRSKLNCRYVQNGVDVIPQGNLRITGASKSGISVVISCGNTDFFDLITGKITELDMHEYDHIWNMENVMASRTRTSGYIYPVINYGNITNDTADIRGQGISPNEMRPATFVKTLVEKIVASAGYTLVNHIADDPVTNAIYDRLLLPFSGDKMIHPKRYVDTYSAQDIEVRLVGNPETTTNNGTIIRVPFTNEVHDAGNNFDGTYWTAPSVMTVNISVTFPHIHVHRTGGGNNSNGAYFKMYRIPAGGGADVKIFELQQHIDFNELYNDHLPVGDRDVPDHHGDWLDVNMAVTGLSVNPGDKIYVAYESSGDSVTVQLYEGATLTVKLNGNNVLFGEQLQLEGTLPDMNCTDFLKFISFMFCAIIQTDNVAKTVTMVPFGYILQQMPNALDWSDRVTEGDEEYDVQIGDYCQQNEAKWQQDDTVSPDTYGNASFIITDQNLDLYQDIYDLPFAATLETPVMGNLRTAFISKITNFDVGDANGLEFVTNTQQRVVLLNKVNLPFNYRWDHALTLVNDNVPLTYFASADNTPDLTLKSIFANHYGDLVNVLNDQRKLTCYLRLTEMDIQTLDFFKPVYIQKYASYFYISKITDYTGVKPCKVELIRL